MPQSGQKPRRANFDEAYSFGGSVSQRNAACGTLMKAARVLPKASWHMRQWQ